MVVLLIFINEYSILCIVITRLKTILDVIIMLGFYLALLDTAEEKSRFEELYLLYRQDMYKTAYSILQDSFEAEDVVHEAFLIVIKKLDKISEIKCPRTHAFLIIIVKNLALKVYNERKKINTYDIDNIEMADSTDIEDEVISEIELSQLENILKQLPEDYYQILFLEQYMGFTIKDISESLSITYENTKKRLQRAKSKLRKLIEESMEDAI